METGEELRVHWFYASTALACAIVACDTSRVDLAHKELMQVRDGIRQGMGPTEIAAVYQRAHPQYVSSPKVSGSVVVIAQSEPQGFAKEWVLWVSLREGRAVALRIRTNDSPAEIPSDAPPDVVWSEEGPGTPFSR